MLRRLFRRRSLERDIQQEFEAHVALEAQILIERGFNPEQAELQARRSFGNRSQIAEKAREAWISAPLDRLQQDLRYASRTLLRNRKFSAAAMLTIALTIGAGTAVYSIADTVFFRPLPYPHPEQLLWVAVHSPRMRLEFLGSPDFIVWRRENHVFQYLGATQLVFGETLLLNRDHPLELRNARVSANFLRTLGVSPVLGRDFNPAEELPNGAKAVLLFYKVWEWQFHRDPGIVGKAIRLDGEAYTVIGVLPPSFAFPSDIPLDILTTLPIAPNLSYHDRNVALWAPYGRLKPGVTLTQARADLARLFDRDRAGVRQLVGPGLKLAVEPLQQHRIGDARKLVSVLIGAVTALLLLASANLSNLLLARWSARSGELAVRTALGAGRARLVRQLLTEAGLLALAGGFLGTMLAIALLRGFVHWAGNEIPRLNEVNADARVFVIGLIVTLFTALLFGGLAALRSGGVHIQNSLQQSGRLGITGGYRFVRQTLVGAELTVSLILLSGAALFSQTLWHLRHDRLGFQPEHILYISIPIKGTKLEGENRAALVQQLLEFTHRIPDVIHSAQTECTPLTAGPITSTFSRADRPSSDTFHPGQNIHLCGTGPEYRVATGLRILVGRYFSENDYHQIHTLAVINETAARIFFPGEAAVGKRIMVGREREWKTVVGIVSDSKNVGLDAAPSPQAFINGSVYPEANQLQFVIRGIGDPRAIESAIAGKLRSLDPGLLADFQPLDQIVGEMSGGARFNSILVGSFAAVAFLIAVVGVYGVVAFAVSQRTQEIGIRIALGSERRRIFALVFRTSIVPVCVGIVAGLATVASLGPYFKVMLYGISPVDPVTMIGVAAALALAASTAIALPARRASAVDPVIALRHY